MGSEISGPWVSHIKAWVQLRAQVRDKGEDFAFHTKYPLKVDGSPSKLKSTQATFIWENK